MKVLHDAVANLPAILIAAGAGVVIAPSAWLELPVPKRQVGIVVAGLGVLLLYGGWYDRFESESEPSETDPVSESEPWDEDPVTQTPAPTTAVDIVRKYVPTVLLTIGAVLVWGQLTSPYKTVNRTGGAGELPWGEQPILGGAFIVSGVVLWLLLSHPRSPFYEAE